MAKTSKKQIQQTAAVYYISILLDRKEIRMILGYCRAYIHLGKMKDLSDIFDLVAKYLPDYEKEDSSHFSPAELTKNLEILSEIFGKLF